MPTLAIGSLAIDPNDEDIVYAGTGDGNFAHHSPYGLGIYKTTDGGTSWSHLAESTFRGRCVHRIVIDPTPVGGVSTTLYAAVVRAGGFPEVSAAKLHPDRRGDVGVFKSTDGGASWTHFTMQANGLPGVPQTRTPCTPLSGTSSGTRTTGSMKRRMGGQVGQSSP